MKLNKFTKLVLDEQAKSVRKTKRVLFNPHPRLRITIRLKDCVKKKWLKE